MLYVCRIFVYIYVSIFFSAGRGSVLFQDSASSSPQGLGSPKSIGVSPLGLSYLLFTFLIILFVILGMKLKQNGSKFPYHIRPYYC